MRSAALVRKLAVYALSHLDGVYSRFRTSGSAKPLPTYCRLICATNDLTGFVRQIQVAVRGSGILSEQNLTGSSSGFFCRWESTLSSAAALTRIPSKYTSEQKQSTLHPVGDVWFFRQFFFDFASSVTYR
jgi:hypothetical protein